MDEDMSFAFSLLTLGDGFFFSFGVGLGGKE
jgi:hypothetical protein